MSVQVRLERGGSRGGERSNIALHIGHISFRWRDSDSGDSLAVRRRCSRVRGWGWLFTLEPGAGPVDTHGQIVIGVAGLEDMRIIVSRHVPKAALEIIDVVAVYGSITSYAGAEAEFVVGDKTRPLVVLRASPKSVSVHQPTNWISTTIGAPVVQLSAFVASLDVHLGEVTDTSHLNIILRPDKVNTLQGAIRNRTSTTPRFRAPRDNFSFSVADSAVWVGRSPQAEILG